MVGTKDDTILVSGAGAPAAVGVIKSLKQAGFLGRVIAVDCDPLSAGFYLADAFAVVPKTSAAEFGEKILEVITREKVTAVFATNGFDMHWFGAHHAELSARGVTPFLSTAAVLELCSDKWQFYEKTKSFVASPLTSKNPSDVVAPFIAKPIHGKGSVGIMTCQNAQEAQPFIARGDYLFQELLPGTEFSVDVLCDLDGKARVAVVRERIATKAGISYKGRVVRHPTIEADSKKLSEFLGLVGCACIQWKLDARGVPKILEVNPRFGGGTIFSVNAGVNIPALMVALLHAEKQSNVSMPEPREVTVLRYFEELTVPDADSPR